MDLLLAEHADVTNVLTRSRAGSDSLFLSGLFVRKREAAAALVNIYLFWISDKLSLNAGRTGLILIDSFRKFSCRWILTLSLDHLLQF